MDHQKPGIPGSLSKCRNLGSFQIWMHTHHLGNLLKIHVSKSQILSHMSGFITHLSTPLQVVPLPHFEKRCSNPYQGQCLICPWWANDLSLNTHKRELKFCKRGRGTVSREHKDLNRRPWAQTKRTWYFDLRSKPKKAAIEYRASNSGRVETPDQLLSGKGKRRVKNLLWIPLP